MDIQHVDPTPTFECREHGAGRRPVRAKLLGFVPLPFLENVGGEVERLIKLRGCKVKQERPMHQRHLDDEVRPIRMSHPRHRMASYSTNATLLNPLVNRDLAFSTLGPLESLDDRRPVGRPDDTILAEAELIFEHKPASRCERVRSTEDLQ